MEGADIWYEASKTPYIPHTIGILSGNRRRVAQNGQGGVFSWPFIASKHNILKTKGDRQIRLLLFFVEVDRNRACAGNLKDFSTPAILLLCATCHNVRM